jgi:alanyl-tRNA synthetase
MNIWSNFGYHPYLEIIVQSAIIKGADTIGRIFMATLKLFHEDAYLTKFQAEVVCLTPRNDGSCAVILDRTAFYPEGGGQPADLGWIEGIRVLDVQEENREIIHFLAEAPDKKQITGIVDWKRRFDHMQQHSGQHLLSAVVYQLTGAETAGFHLGAQSSQIDITRDTLTREEATLIEDHANQLLFQNSPILTHYATEATVSSYPIRKQPPKGIDRIRLIEFPEVDCCPCAGTHVKRTAEIGLIKIRSWERKKGLVRIDFVCGSRALTDYQLLNAVVNTLSARFSAPVPELLPAVDRHFAKDEQLEQHFLVLKQDFNGYLVKDLLHSGACNGIRVITHIMPSAAPQDVTDLARRLAANEQVIALIGGINSEQTKNHLTFACSPDVQINMGEQLKAVLPLINGKGGGSAQSAQGGGTDTGQTARALEAARKNILQLL